MVPASPFMRRAMRFWLPVVIMYPPAAELPILQQWSGLRPGIADDIPVIAEHPQCAGVWINSGHYRNGGHGTGFGAAAGNI